MSEEIYISVLASLAFILMLASLVYMISLKLKVIPFPLLLFLTGIILNNLNIGILDSIRLTPNSVLFIYLPILLFESAYRFKFIEFKKIFIPGFLLSTVGLFISAIIITLPLTYLFSIPTLEAFLYAAVISSTDPIAVLSIFKSLGVPKRLQLLVDGESFLNDATSVIVFRVLVGILGIGTIHSTQVPVDNILGNFIQFFYVLIGGCLIGTFMGWIFSEVISFIKDVPIIEVTLTIVLANIVFLIAEAIFNTSGIVAVLAAGLMIGNYGKSKISPRAEHTLHQTWDEIGFITTSLVFILIGYEISLKFLTTNLVEVTIITIAMLIARSIAVYLIGASYNLVSKNPIPSSWWHIVNIGGVRGVLPMVILFSLPDSFMHKQLFIQLVLSAILFTLIVNTLLIPALIKKLNINKLSSVEDLEVKLTEIILIPNMLGNLKKLYQLKEISKDIYTKHEKELQARIDNLTQEIVDIYCMNEEGKIDYESDLANVLRRYFLLTEKSSYHHLYEKQIIDVHLYEKLILSISNQLSCIEKGTPQFREQRTDIDSKLKKLHSMNFSITSILKRFFGRSEEANLNSIYLYYKARIIGDEKVIEDIEELAKFNLRVLTDFSIDQILKYYKEFLKHNQQVLKTLREKYPQLTEQIEEGIYQKEYAGLKDKLICELGDQEKISDKALSLLNKPN